MVKITFEVNPEGVEFFDLVDTQEAIEQIYGEFGWDVVYTTEQPVKNTAVMLRLEFDFEVSGGSKFGIPFTLENFKLWTDIERYKRKESIEGLEIYNYPEEG